MLGLPAIKVHGTGYVVRLCDVRFSVYLPSSEVANCQEWSIHIL